ncbi:MAG: EAL domain-containing protein [Lachnospiraceae bacterium]|nr:EAL domain-containing protein [Lachnospiraceae bacterium]
MSISLTFDLVAISVIVILLIYFQRKRSAPIASYRLFYKVLINLLVMGTLDILTCVCMENPDLASPFMIGCINATSLCVQMFLFAVYAAYVLCVATIDANPPAYWLYSIYTPCVLVILIVSGFAIRGGIIGDSPELFRLNPVLHVVLVMVVLYEMILFIIIGIRYRRVLGLKRNIHAVTAGMCMAAAEILQILEPDICITIFIGAIVMADLLMAVQRPEEIFESTDAMKKKYIFESARLDFERGRSFGMVFIRILDYSVLTESLGKEDTEVFLRHVTLFLSELKHNALVFQLDNDLMAVKFTSSGRLENDSLFEEICARFKEPWRNGFIESMLSVGYMRLDCPEDVKDLGAFEHVMAKLNLIRMQPGEECSVSRLLDDDKEQQILKAIRRALDEDRFEVYYQPIYSTHDKKVIAAEALIRLFDPEYGYIHPEPMIAIAEREGYILRIGEIVFTEVCRFYSENKLDKLGIEYIEVNLSAVQCMQKHLAEQFIDIMNKYKLGPERINFEITESSAMINDAEVSRNIERFEKKGVSLSLDDYGTGYSNISYLYNLPFVIMKVDKSILWSSEKNVKADIILKNTFRMANRLNMKVVMEGVETEDQIRKLLALNCDYFQGYYFSKPIEGGKFIEYIKGFSLPEVCK